MVRSRFLLAVLLAVATVGASADDGRLWVGDDGTRVVNQARPRLAGRAWADPGATARGDAPPAAVRAALSGVARARALLTGQLGLKDRSVQITLVHGPPAVVRTGSSTTLVLDAGLLPIDLRHQAIEQYTRVAASELPETWTDALSTWSLLRLASFEASGIAERRPDGVIDLRHGDPLWFEFLHDAYGITAVRVAVEELAGSGSPVSSFDRALSRVATGGLAEALREYLVWTTLVGSRADDHHFVFSAKLGDPVFASSADGLPALNVLADAPLPAWGATRVRLDPSRARGGMNVLFEGEPEAVWDVDLLLVDERGTLRRVAFDLGSDGRGSMTVPADGLAEALMLIRIVGGDAAAARYSYASSLELGWPYELAGLQAEAMDGGVDVGWETSSERDLVGFNVLRSRVDGGLEVAVNPVWIPALGTETDSTEYRFFDATAELGVAYRYSVEGISSRGLTRRTDVVVVGDRTAPSPVSRRR